MLIKLYEGNNSEAEKNCLIVEMNFTELPPGIKGTVSIQIVLEVDECLNLNLIATETITKKEVKMAVNYEQFRLKKEYMDLRFKMRISHVDNPMQKRTMRREIARLNTFIQQKASAGENK